MEKKPINFVWHYLKIFKWYWLMIFVCLIIAQLCSQASPYFMAKIFNLVAGQEPSEEYWSQIIYLALMVSGLSLFRMLFYEGTQFIDAKFAPKANSLVVRDVFDYVNKQSISYFVNEMTGSISKKVEQLASGLTGFFDHMYGALFGTINITVCVIYLTIVSWYYLLAMSLWIAIVVLVSVKLGNIRRAMGKETSKKESNASAMVVDAISNYSEIKSFANFKFERFNLLKALRDLRKCESKEKMMMGWIRFIQQLVSIISVVSFLFLSVYLLKIKTIDTTEFIFANTIFLNISGAVFHLSWLYNSFSRIFGKLSSALETIAVEPSIVDKKNALNLKCKKAEISFENVVFGYNDKNPLFKNLNLTIKKGSKVGLVGFSGSGKSTFIKLIGRYYDIRSGAIKINGLDIRDLTQESLHRSISTIPQDVCLFNRSLFDNIRYGKTGALEKEVSMAAKKAYADIFIKDFPQGYQTKVGDRGVVLSGGERQRIAIARAILKDAPILIFDEATSALDTQSERYIQKSLQGLMKGKTVLAIAHRLSTLREMDRILVFDKGKIVEDGTHEELLQKAGKYQKLYNMQFEID